MGSLIFLSWLNSPCIYASITSVNIVLNKPLGTGLMPVPRGRDI